MQARTPTSSTSTDERVVQQQVAGNPQRHLRKREKVTEEVPRHEGPVQRLPVDHGGIEQIVGEPATADQRHAHQHCLDRQKHCQWAPPERARRRGSLCLGEAHEWCLYRGLIGHLFAGLSTAGPTDAVAGSVSGSGSGTERLRPRIMNGFSTPW